MPHLRHTELQALSIFLADLYALRDLRAFRSHLVAALPKVVAADITSYNEVDPSNSQNECVCDNPEALEFPDSTEIFNKHIGEHPLITHFARVRDRRALKISDFLSRAQFHRLGLYNEFYQRTATEHQIAFTFTLPTRPSLLMGIALGRGSLDFSESDRLLLELIRPHLIQAFRNAEAFSHLVQALEAAASTGDKVERGVILLDGRRRIRLMTSQAERCIRKYFSMRRSGNLPEELDRWLRLVESSAESNLTAPRMPLIVRQPLGQLVVRLVPKRGADLLLFDEKTTGTSRENLLGFGLSEREADVLVWVSEGKTNHEIGAILGISSRTVQKHLEHVFQKLGVETRTAAARVCRVA